MPSRSLVNWLASKYLLSCSIEMSECCQKISYSQSQFITKLKRKTRQTNLKIIFRASERSFLLLPKSIRLDDKNMVNLIIVILLKKNSFKNLFHYFSIQNLLANFAESSRAASQPRICDHACQLRIRSCAAA